MIVNYELFLYKRHIICIVKDEEIKVRVEIEKTFVV